jgi:hypothetical protein
MLEDDLVVLPGHGEPTTIDEEKYENYCNYRGVQSGNNGVIGTGCVGRVTGTRFSDMGTAPVSISLEKIERLGQAASFMSSKKW